jgi:hypothetical protein
LQRTTSYGFLATLSSVKPINKGTTATCGLKSVYYQLKNNPKLCIQNATLIHAGTSNDHFYKANVDMDKVLAAERD